MPLFVRNWKMHVTHVKISIETRPVYRINEVMVIIKFFSVFILPAYFAFMDAS